MLEEKEPKNKQAKNKQETSTNQNNRATRSKSRTRRDTNPLTILDHCEKLVKASYTPYSFAYSFLEAYEISKVTIDRLKEGEYNKTDLTPKMNVAAHDGGALLVPGSIHLFALPHPETPFSAPFSALSSGNFPSLEPKDSTDSTDSKNASPISGGIEVKGAQEAQEAPTEKAQPEKTQPENDDLFRVFEALKASPATKREKVRFVLATNGVDIYAQNCHSEEDHFFSFADLPNQCAFFFPLAGICVPKGRSGNLAVDIKATDKLNKLYTHLLEKNTAWSQEKDRHAMNHFITRLIFCFFAENTHIFPEKLFTQTLRDFSRPDGSTVQEVISACFRAMDTPQESRSIANLPAYVQQVPYVNGRLFAPYDESDAPDTPATEIPGTDIPDIPDFYAPVFDKVARAHLLTIGELNWSEIKPDIFGSMIQAIAEEEERSSLGMHYTSVENILNLLNPLFLESLRTALKDAGEDRGKLSALRERLSRIRVFDPACGAGNFLVIAYQQLRALEFEINKKLHQETAPSKINLTNFRGIELRDFPARVARIALVIAEFQCNTQYLGAKHAREEILPLSRDNWVTCGNALLLNWHDLCPPCGTETRATNTTLLEATPKDHKNIAFANTGGETYLCGNPPYKGYHLQTADQKSDMKMVFDGITPRWKSFDYVCGFVYKAAEYCANTPKARAALVSTNSLCQGQSVPYFFPLILGRTPPSRREAQTRAQQTMLQQTTTQRKRAA